MRDPVKRAFHNHRRNARLRGIQFKFTFEEWVAWWEAKLGPEWFEKRGNVRGMFVMARLRDEGSYQFNNVKCITFEANSLDKVPNGKTTFGEKHPMVKLTSHEALTIKRSMEAIDVLSKRFSISKSTINDIRKGRRWKHLPSCNGP